MAEVKKLTTFEAACVIAGSGIGGGIMAVPYLASRTGLLSLSLTALVAFAAALLLHLMILEAALKAPGMQILTILDRFLFKGRKPLIYIFFALIALGTVSNLSAYLSGSAAVMEGWGMNGAIAIGAFYAICAAIVLFGIKSMGIGEKAGVIGMLGIAAYMAIVSTARPAVPAKASFDPSGWLALYSMMMFCLGAYFAIPQVVKGLGADGRRSAIAVFWGLLANIAITMVISLSMTRVSDPVTKVAIVGWSESIGGASGAIGSVFVWLALATSFWSQSYALKDIVMEQFAVKRHTVAWLMATAPSVVMLAAGAGFIEMLKLAGGATALILLFTLLPAFANSRKQPGEWSMGAWGGRLALMMVLIAYLAMAAGSLIPVD